MRLMNVGIGVVVAGLGGAASSNELARHARIDKNDPRGENTLRGHIAWTAGTGLFIGSCAALGRVALKLPSPLQAAWLGLSAGMVGAALLSVIRD